jgi:hypothetical protein
VSTVIQGDNIRRSQSRLESFFEQAGATLLLLCLTFVTAQLIVYPLFDVPISSAQNMGVTLWFACQNTMIRYIIRRRVEKKLKLEL